MQHKYKTLAAVAFALSYFAWYVPTAAHAQSAPRTLSYQGVLKHTGCPWMDDTNPAGLRLLTITLYGDAYGGSKLWQKSGLTEIDSMGIFNVTLGGDDNPLPEPQAMDRPIWLGVAVDNGPEMRPLSEMTASAYALNVVDNAITTAKIADSSITPSKLNLDYISSININGVQFTGHGTPLNIQGENGITAAYKADSNTLVLYGTAGSGQNAPTPNSGVYWSEAGNNSTSPGTSYIGTSDDEALWFKVNAGIVMRYVPITTGDMIPDIIGGAPNNNIDEDAGASGGNVIGGGGNNGTGTAADQNEIYYCHYATISGGLGNRINPDFSTDSLDVLKFQVIGGGEKNHVDRKWSAIVGGHFNKALGEFGMIGAGYDNILDTATEYSTVGGGNENHIYDSYDFIGGGDTNRIYVGGPYSAIAGGRYNRIEASYDAIGGGDTNTVLNDYSEIGGGLKNYLQGTLGMIGGGDSNQIIAGDGSAKFDAIGGGVKNVIEYSDTGFIGGGDTNNIDNSPTGVIGGGSFNNLLSTQGSMIGGGHSNSIAGLVAPDTMDFIGGGMTNRISDGNYVVISGGDSNSSVSGFNSINGGRKNSTKSMFSHIGGGDTNYIFNFPYSAISGGQQNDIELLDSDAGDHSFIGGGDKNTIQSGTSVIGGGSLNIIPPFSEHSIIGGGETNTIERGMIHATIGGGVYNDIDGISGTIAGGDTNSVVYEEGFVGGGDHNQAETGHATIAGGSYNEITSANYGYGFIGGGAYNYMEEEYNTIGGGAGNRIWDYDGYENTYYDIIGGGFYDTIRSSFNAVIGGGDANVIDDLSNRGTIGGGGGNWVRSQSATIAGGNTNLIFTSSDYSTIGGGILNNIRSTYSTIAGGDTNNILANSGFGSIGGGKLNIVQQPYATIPGGDSLIANSFAQTVIGYNNIQSGSFTQGTGHAFGSNSVTTQDLPILIIGNGNGRGVNPRSNAFEVTYDGHAIVTDQNGNKSSGLARTPIYGATYNDNLIAAWGDISPVAGPYPKPATINSDFGVTTVTEESDGVFLVTFVANKPDGVGAETLSNGSITVTTVDNTIFTDTSGNCGYATSSQIGAAGSTGNGFVIRTYTGAGSGSCVAQGKEFFFKLCGR